MEGHLRARTTRLLSTETRDDYQYLMANKFPWKLWKIVRDCRSGSIRWNEDGQNIVLHKSKFQREYLDPNRKTFKTKNIGSFVRQLNLYGFKKVQPGCKQFHFDGSLADQETQEFHSELFQRGRPDLVNELRRHVGIRRAKEQAAKRLRLLESSVPANLLSTLSKPKTPLKQLKLSSNLHNSGSVLMYPGTPPPPSMVAIPIYSDGIPYLNASVPPVLIEYDHGKWVATGTVANAVVQPNQLEGAHLTVSQADSERSAVKTEVSHLVNAVSEALQSVPQLQLHTCLSEMHKQHQWLDRPETPIYDDCSFADTTLSIDEEESPISLSTSSSSSSSSLRHASRIQPGESLLRFGSPPRSSSPNSPSAGVTLDGLDLSPIIVACESSLVQAAIHMGAIEAMMDVEDVLMKY